MYFDPYNHTYYYTLRHHSRSVVVSAINNKIKCQGERNKWDRMTLASIDSDALSAARLEWPKYYGEMTHPGFQESWERLFYKFSNRPSFFDLAVWQVVDGKRVLQGLALGRPSNGKTHLTLHWIERSFAPTYFKGGILLPILACAEEYAKLLGSQRVLIKDPVDPEVYRGYGYTSYNGLPRAAGRYLAKEV